MNQQKRPQAAQRNNSPAASQKKQQGYFEYRFMTDEEHVLHREKYIKLGLIRPDAYPTGIEKQSFYNSRGEREFGDVVVVFKTKEESAALRVDLIDKGIITPKEFRAARAARVARMGNA